MASLCEKGCPRTSRMPGSSNRWLQATFLPVSCNVRGNYLQDLRSKNLQQIRAAIRCGALVSKKKLETFARDRSRPRPIEKAQQAHAALLQKNLPSRPFLPLDSGTATSPMS